MDQELISADSLDASIQPFIKAQADHEDRLMALPNVVGVGVAHKWTDGRDTGDPAVAVLVENKMDKALLAEEDQVPALVGRRKTDVYEIGTIIAGGRAAAAVDLTETLPQDVSAFSLTQRARPAMGGYSIGHVDITAGTAATGAYDQRPFPGEAAHYYILSNNHVLANSNGAKPGDPILQPGPADGGTFPQDFIGRLSRYVPIRFGGPCNYVDAAIAETRFEWFTREVYYIGYSASLFQPASVNQILKKTGRTTSFTTGNVTVVNATVNVNYGASGVAKFCNQIITTDMSAPGDSGSLVLDQQNNPVGLLFAGSSTVTIMNPINLVQAYLGIRIWP